LSRMMGNYHVRFLGGKGAAMPPTYPIFNTPKIFTHYFKEEYKMTPTEYRKKKEASPNEAQ